MTFIFYDTETTGLETAFDQVLQFAAVVTDDNFNILSEINLRSRPKSHLIVSPSAMLVTRVGPRAIGAAALSSYEMISQIRDFIEHWSPAILIGFNSIGFDENMLRQAFFQSLLPIYLTNTNGNSRMDVLRLAHAVAEHQPEALALPLNEKGKPSFKLAHLIQENGLSLTNAHDALADARATVALAKFLKGRALRIWEDQFACRSRRAVEQLVMQNPLLLFTDRTFKKPTILAGALCSNPKNPTAIAMFDLEYDPTTFLDASVEEVSKLLKASPRPIRILKANASPIISPYRNDRDMGVNPELAMQRLDRLKAHAPFMATLAQAMTNMGDEYGDPSHIEETIYSGFPTTQDKMLMEAFHKAPWAERYALLEKFQDRRYQVLGERLIFEEAPGALPENRRAALEAWRSERLHSTDDVPWRTFGKAVAELEKKLRAEATAGDEEAIAEIEQYLLELKTRLPEQKSTAVYQ